ncbi:MAG: hypothetical protein V9E81_15610 [Marmoricola sp.]
MTRQIVDLTDEQARRSLVLKWGSVPADVLLGLGRRDGLPG